MRQHDFSVARRVAMLQHDRRDGQESGLLLLVEAIMQRYFHAAVLAFVVLWLTGCPESPTSGPSPTASSSVAKPSPPPPPPPPKVAPPPTPSPQAPPPSISSSPPAPVPPSAPSPPPASSAVTSPPAAKQSVATPSQGAVPPSIRLSMGVALPQTGPDGILMSFSVDYRAPPSIAKSQANKTNAPDYIWVIQRRTARHSSRPSISADIIRWWF